MSGGVVHAVVVETIFVVVGAAVLVMIVVALGLMLRQLQPSEILAWAKAARRGRTLTTGAASGSASGSANRMATPLFFGLWTTSGRGHTELVVVIVEVEVTEVLPYKSVLHLRSRARH